MYIKKGDSVKMISGKDKGKKGKVLQVLAKDGRVVVEGLNMMAKSVRAKRMGEKGQVVRYNAPVTASNVLLFCSKCNKAVKVGFNISKDGKKTRVCRKCKQNI